MNTNWQHENYAALLAEIDSLKHALHSHLPSEAEQPSAANEKPSSVAYSTGSQVLHAANLSTKTSTTVTNIATAEQQPEPKAETELKKKGSKSWGLDEDTRQVSVMLNNLCDLFGLSFFDRQLLLLCIATELDADIAQLCTQLNAQPFPTLALALQCFEGHCSAVTPEAPLVYFQLVDLKHDNNSFMHRRMAISEWALFYVTGEPVLDEALSNCLSPVQLLEPTLATQQTCAQQLAQARAYSSDLTSVMQLISKKGGDHQQIAALLAKQEKREVYEFNLYHLPLRLDEQKLFLRTLERELIARQCLLLIDCQRLVASGESMVDRYALGNGLDCLIRDLPNACLLYASEQIELPQTSIHPQPLPVLPVDEQFQLWQHCLPNSNNEQIQTTLSALTNQYNLTAGQVRTIARSARMDSAASESTGGSATLPEKLWQHSREQSRQNLHGLAQVISPTDLNWDDLVLADKEKASLQSIVVQAQQRQQVYQQWGFGKQASYGLGICALFAGGSGTGKTMAARIIASLLNLDLYHVDLSNVVDKYIGETEKKLDKLFQAAENSGAVLLFDEADALFGKRTNVQDSRDRYANMGVSFLLQRMERYSGLSILTTNLRSAMDAAFTRRLRFIVQFPFPSEKSRENIWQCMMPANAPTQNIDFQKLGRLVLAGGAIRNIILQAAFIAAEAKQPITMQCLHEAVRQEYIKAEKTLDENLVKDW